MEFVASTLARVDETKRNRNASPHILIHELLACTNSLAQQFVEYALGNPKSTVARYVPMALPRIYSEDVVAGRAFTSRILASGCAELRTSLARCLGHILGNLSSGEYELGILKGLLSSDDEHEVATAVDQLRHVGALDAPKALELIRITNFCGSQYVADEAFSLFGSPGLIPFDLLDSGSVSALLEKLFPLPVLEKHWIQTFLASTSARYPVETLDFFKRRVMHAASTDDYAFRPCNSRPYAHKPLRFVETAAFEDLLKDTWSWMRGADKDDHHFQWFATDLFGTAFPVTNGRTLSFMRNKFSGDRLDISIIGKILRDAHHTFSLDNPTFVFGYLSAAKSHGSKCLESAISELYCAAVNGGKQGTPGEPFPRDLEALEKAKSILDSLPRFSPAYRLYDLIKRDAEKNIAESLKERELFEE